MNSSIYTFFITRMFDARVSSFIKNILMGGGREVSFKYHSYRVEFQARGKTFFLHDRFISNLHIGMNKLHYQMTIAIKLLTRFSSFWVGHMTNCIFDNLKKYKSQKIFTLLGAIDHMNKYDLKELIKYVITLLVFSHMTN